MKQYQIDQMRESLDNIISTLGDPLDGVSSETLIKKVDILEQVVRNLAQSVRGLLSDSEQMNIPANMGANDIMKGAPFDIGSDDQDPKQKP